MLPDQVEENLGLNLDDIFADTNFGFYDEEEEAPAEGSAEDLGFELPEGLPEGLELPIAKSYTPDEYVSNYSPSEPVDYLDFENGY